MGLSAILMSGPERLEQLAAFRQLQRLPGIIMHSNQQEAFLFRHIRDALRSQVRAHAQNLRHGQDRPIRRASQRHEIASVTAALRKATRRWPRRVDRHR